jgi:hypothetical protein
LRKDKGHNGLPVEIRKEKEDEKKKKVKETFIVEQTQLDSFYQHCWCS